MKTVLATGSVMNALACHQYSRGIEKKLVLSSSFLGWFDSVIEH